MQRYDVLLVNPIRDGLNLVAMEGPALNRRDGLLCLSPRPARTTSAQATLAVHPYDIEAAARTLDRALATPLDERGAIRRACGHSPPRGTRPCGSAISSRTRPRRADRRHDSSRRTTPARSRVRPAGPSTRPSTASGSAAGISIDFTPIRSARPSRPSAAARGKHVERGEIARVVAGEHANSEAGDERVDRGPLVDRDGRPQLQREPRAPLRELVTPGQLGGHREHLVGAIGVVRQCNVTLTPALRSTSTPGSRVSASSAAAATAGR